MTAGRGADHVRPSSRVKVACSGYTVKIQQKYSEIQQIQQIQHVTYSGNIVENTMENTVGVQWEYSGKYSRKYTGNIYVQIMPC